MDRCRRAFAVAVCLLAFSVSFSGACSLCGGVRTRESLLTQYRQAEAAATGTLANPRLAADIVNGKSTTEFHVDRVLKAPAGEKFPPLHILDRYIPVLDPKDPPRFVHFFLKRNGKWNTLGGTSIRSAALEEYLKKATALPDDDLAARLRFASEWFDHEDAPAAEEAFLEWAKAPDEAVAKAAKSVSAARVRNVLKRSDLEGAQISLFAFLLGACGDESDLPMLDAMAARPTHAQKQGMEGILAGEIALNPKAGWARLRTLLADRKSDVISRLCAIRALRFHLANDPKSVRPIFSGCMADLLDDSQLADHAMNELIAAKVWDHSKAVFSLLDKQGYQSVITRNAILRYIVACPTDEARVFLSIARQRYPDDIRDFEKERELLQGSSY